MARYLVTGEFVDPGALLPPQQLAQLIEKFVLPSFEAMAKLEEKKKIFGSRLSPVLGLVPSSSTWLPTVRSIKYYKGYPSGAWSSGLSLLCKNIGSGQPMRKRLSNR